MNYGLMLDDDFPNIATKKKRGGSKKKNFKLRVDENPVKTKEQIRNKRHRAERAPVYLGNRTDDAILEKAMWNMPTNGKVGR